MFHGAGNLDKAINLLPDKDRDDFRYFTHTKIRSPEEICLYVIPLI